MTTRRLLPAAVFLLLLASFLRFHRLEAQSFWNDEGNSARLSERSIPAILEGTASDIHPPLYYLLLRGWRELVGETEFGLRAFSAHAGVLTVATVMALARAVTAERRRQTTYPPPSVVHRLPSAMGGRPSAVVPALAGLFAAVSPVLVYYSQETRMYALLALLAALSTWMLLVWLSGATRGWGWAVAYVMLVAAGLYTHYFFPAIIVAQGVVVWASDILRIRDTKYRIRDADAGLHLVSRMSHQVVGRSLLIWIGVVTVAAALYLPWAPIFLRQIGGRGDASAGPLAFAVESVRWLALGGTVRPDEAIWAVAAFILLVILGAVVGRPRSVGFLILAAVPLFLMFLAGATDPAFFKFMLAVAPFTAVLMGLAWRTRGAWVVAPAVLTVVVLAGSLLSLGNLYADPAFARADYRGMAARIAAEADSNAGVILIAPNQWEAFTYYHRDGAPVYPLPRGQPDPALLEPELARIVATHDRLYVLYWGEAQRDPEGVIERWLDANTFKVTEEWVGDVRFAVYAVPHDMPMPATPSGATFAGRDGETITLHEFAVWPTEARPGDVVQARLLWSADATPARPYKVFLHLLDGAGNLMAQRDGEPGGGSRPTTGWAPGERVTDNLALLLPPDLPPGEYTLRLGLYDAFDPAVRLAIDGDDGLGVGIITVGNP